MPKVKSKRRRRITVEKVIGRLEIAAAVLPLTCEQWATIAAILFPTLYLDPRYDPSPTESLPGSPAKVADLTARQQKGRRLWSRRDADPARDDRLAARVRRSANGDIVWVD